MTTTHPDDARPRRRLIERFRRRVDFDPDDGFSAPVRLADGDAWHLARPWLEIVPRFRSGRAVGRDEFLTCGEEFDALIAAVSEDLDGPAFILAVMTVGAALLTRNYDLTNDELGRLFTFRPGDPESARMLQEIMGVATGRSTALFGRSAVDDPKPSAAG